MIAHHSSYCAFEDKNMAGFVRESSLPLQEANGYLSSASLPWPVDDVKI
jgi:hypothetical protein